MNLNFKRMSKDESHELMLKHRQNREKRLSESQMVQYAEVPEQYKNVFVKAYVETGYVDKIKAKCLDCTCFQQGEIRNCECFGCPLWKIRPYQ